jgi:hypothetical protein
MKVQLTHVVSRIAGLSIVLVLSSAARAQLSQQEQDKVTQIAQSLASQPSRVVLKPTSQGVPVGQTSQVQVTLVDADSKTVTADTDEVITVQLKSPSGATRSTNVVIAKGQSSAGVPVASDAVGLTTVTAQPSSKTIRPGNVDVLFVPSTKKASVATKPTKRSSLNLVLPRILSQDGREGAMELVALRRTAQVTNTSQVARKVVTGSSQIYLTVDNADADYIANGSDPFQISAYFESPDGLPASRNVDIWFQNDRGVLNPNHISDSQGRVLGFYGSNINLAIRSTC